VVKIQCDEDGYMITNPECISVCMMSYIPHPSKRLHVCPMMGHCEEVDLVDLAENLFRRVQDVPGERRRLQPGA
jgi:hypothetical protein